VLLLCAALVSAASVGVALIAIGALHRMYFDRRNLPDLEAFRRFEFLTIGHVPTATASRSLTSRESSERSPR
jgi:hypothetical protein